MPFAKEEKKITVEKWQQRATDLIANQKTLVLATCADNHPWAAPVYYVYLKSKFYFFSSPNSKHAENALKNEKNAASIFSDGDQLEQIEGLQIVGRIEVVQKQMERIKVTAAYFKKFPFSRKVLAEKEIGGMDLGTKVTLYVLCPDEMYYTNNLMGFGSRLALNV
jgi:uncharacterized protein YhbP (UPF0306 family)